MRSVLFTGGGVAHHAAGLVHAPVVGLALVLSTVESPLFATGCIGVGFVVVGVGDSEFLVSCLCGAVPQTAFTC